MTYPHGIATLRDRAAHLAGRRRVARAAAAFALLFAVPLAHVDLAHAASAVEVAGWYQQAQINERVGRTAQAIVLYRRVWEAVPVRFDAVSRGAELLVASRREAEALTWLAEAVGRTPEVPPLWAEYGDILDRLGRTSDADSAWARGAEVCRDATPLYLAIVDRLVERGRLSRARQWAERGARATGGHPALNRRLMDIALAEGSFSAAAGYGSAYAGSGRERVSEATAVLAAAQPPAAAQDSMAATALRLADEDSANPGRTLFAGDLALAARRTADAERCYLRAARQAGIDMRQILLLATDLDQRGQDDIAAALREIVVGRFPQAPQAVVSAMTAAEHFDRSGQRDRAIRLYRWTLTQPDRTYQDRAHLALGRLLLAGGGVAEAKLHFGAVLQRGGTPLVQRRAMFGLADCALREGRLDEAAARWQALAIGTFPDVAEARLRLAELAMYRGDAQALAERCEQLMRETPEADEANNCLALTAVLSEAAGDTAAWRRYGELRYLLDRGEYRAVLGRAEALAGTALAGAALVLVAEARRATGDAEGATAALEDVADRFRGTTTGEEALWRLAELERAQLKDPARALRTYERLLQDYPDGVYTGPARRWVRALRAETGAT